MGLMMMKTICVSLSPQRYDVYHLRYLNFNYQGDNFLTLRFFSFCLTSFTEIITK